jgi:ATP/maltotriose-dependent transcriptional regulator MalT
LTLVQAGTGYGKSTALATLAEEIQPLAWYHLAAEDVDPVVFLLHLFYALSTVLPELPETPLASLEAWERNRGKPLWSDVVDILTDILIDQVRSSVTPVIDDAHLLNSSAEALRILDRFIGRSPRQANLLSKLPTD